MGRINRDGAAMRTLILLLLLLPAMSQSALLSGNLSSAGSDTLGTLMTLWSEDFSLRSPGVNVQVQASGSQCACRLACD